MFANQFGQFGEVRKARSRHPQTLLKHVHPPQPDQKGVRTTECVGCPEVETRKLASLQGRPIFSATSVHLRNTRYLRVSASGQPCSEASLRVSTARCLPLLFLSPLKGFRICFSLPSLVPYVPVNIRQTRSLRLRPLQRSRRQAVHRLQQQLEATAHRPLQRS